MNGALQITFRGIEPSPALDSRIRERAAKLERYNGRIDACRVVVDAPHRHQNKGRLYSVRVVLTLPGHDVLASKGDGQDHAHEDVYVAIRDAFDAAERQLDGFARKKDRSAAAGDGHSSLR